MQSMLGKQCSRLSRLRLAAGETARPRRLGDLRCAKRKGFVAMGVGKLNCWVNLGCLTAIIIIIIVITIIQVLHTRLRSACFFGLLFNLGPQ